MKSLGSVLLVAALVFGICFLVDKGFVKLFRSREQHKSGLSLRPNKKYGAIGLILVVLGIAAVFTGLKEELLLTLGGGFLILLGIAMIVYYMTTGVYYDDNSFLYSSFGKKGRTYRYGDIRAQQLYTSYGSISVELFMADGKSVTIQCSMAGAYDFLDKAFDAWCTQRGIAAQDCPFHDPENSCWFPPAGEEI